MNPLIRLIPPSLVRFFAKPYVAGDSLDKAVDTAAMLLSTRGILTTLDLLAEGIDSREVAAQNQQTYIGMIDAVAADPRLQADGQRPTVSLKPSSYTTAGLEVGGDAAGSLESLSW